MRRVKPDEEGYLYFAKSDAGVVYGPYSQRSTAAGVATQMTPYRVRNEYNYRFDHGRYANVREPNPSYAPNRVLKVYKAKLSDFVDAPYESIETKYQRALEKLQRIEKMLNDRGFDIQVD